MNEPRASRLKEGGGRRRGYLLADKLPLGSLKRKLVFRLAVPLFFFLIAVWTVDAIVMPMITRHGDEFLLPEFVDQKYLEAQVRLNELDLSWEEASREYSPGKEAGVILQQFPVAGTKVKSGRTIKFVTSLGQKMIAIPQLAGQSVRQAMLDLETAGLILGEIAWAFSDTLPERVVVFSYPSAGSEIPLGSRVNLMVNRGRASNFTYMPKVRGVTLEEAIKRITDKTLKLGVITYRVDENYLPETVLEQSEPEGAELDIGTEIDLVVSSTD